MSNGLTNLYMHEFQDSDTVVINHRLNRSYIGGIRLFVDKVSRSDLVASIIVSPDDPKNIMTVQLEEVCSGVIQLVGTNYLRLGQASTQQASTSMVFGVENKFGASSSVVQTTSGNDWVQKLSSVKTLEKGTYRIGISYVWSSSSTKKGNKFNARFMLNDDELLLHRETSVQEDENVPVSFFVYRTLEAGDYDISLQFKREGSSMSVSMSNANVEIWKTSNV